MTLLEIQKAADALSIDEKWDLIIFLLRRLRDNQVELPPVRDIPEETIEKWIEDDESGYNFSLIQNRQNLRKTRFQEGWQAFWDFDTIKNKVWLKNYFTRKASIHASPQTFYQVLC
jgi:hypothetical protein